jgi:putative tryptophan/tyrosine transport system substrate-binding protein
MRRREFITLLGGTLAVWPLPTSAQQKTTAVVGFLGTASDIRLKSAFEMRLRELGWIEGQNLVIEYRWAAGDLARFPALVDELVRLRPDLMVAGSNQAAIAMRQATTVIPIVAPTLFDPVGSGLVASLARPGGNVTGITSQDTLPGKQLELAAEVVRGAVKMGMLFNPEFQGHVIRRKAAEAAAAALAIKLVPVEARLPDDLDAAFQSMARERVDCVIVLGEPMVFAERRRIAALAIEARLPTMFGNREHVEAGGLMSYGGNLRPNFRRAADYVDKILKGTKPADLPVEQPTKFDLVINLKTAKAIGLTIPEAFLLRADEVIE